jgi:hypothetical protein
VRNDPLVIVSYLGTDQQAINRSGEAASALKDAIALPVTGSEPRLPS